ncbi:uncharacterized protein LOC115756644 [Rhodamnia argentea]|uniref:Uncharacterized protein LOC115756644 n=1 Tax=Rhodamnia argentea TaxID=178133 RepID=A0ABM3H4G6_9MYRT|nr:uncharacterized protein LOC115756644 [Rhodamnia argentea]
MRPSQLFLFVVLFAVSLKSTQAIRPFECEVFDNTSGTPDTRFRGESKRDGGRGYDFVLLVVESFVANGRPFAIATTNGSRIYVNADYLQIFPGNMTDEFTGIVYFMSGLVWEWTGNGNAPTGLITGMADYIRLTAGWRYWGWPRRGSGLRWDEGYATTANFLEFCELLRPGFVSDLNAMMIDSYSDVYFWELLGKSVDVLWEEYKLFYGSPGPAPAQTFGY